MADLNKLLTPLFLNEGEIRKILELLFFSYRDFTEGPDKILEKINFGRAHHRVIYFVSQNPNINVSELLAILRITKQSLSRVLGKLVKEGFVKQRPGKQDRRKRLLELTNKGRELEQRLTQTQLERVARTYRAAGADAVEGYRDVLLGMINKDYQQ